MLGLGGMLHETVVVGAWVIFKTSVLQQIVYSLTGFWEKNVKIESYSIVTDYTMIIFLYEKQDCPFKCSVMLLTAIDNAFA